jgi:sec-independent protein translocase protein TatA
MIPGVPSMGGMELVIILAVVLLFFGARRLPQLGRSLGQGLREFRKGTSGDSDGNKDETRELKEKRELPREEEDNPKEAPAQAEPEDAREGLSTERTL